MKTEFRHIDSLDGIRGLAILTVVFFHYSGGRHFDSRFMQILGHCFDFGWIGVDLFFVLSGFLITSILFKNRNTDNYLYAFYGRRILRIFPIYYTVVISTFLISFLTGNIVKLDQYSFFFFLNNAAVVFDSSVGTMQGTNMGMSHFWSLAVEEQFYLFWPLVIRTVNNEKKLIYALLALIISAFILRFYLVAVYDNSDIAFRAAYNLLPTRMDALSSGSLLAILWKRGHLPNVGDWVPQLLFMAGVAGFALCSVIGGTMTSNSFPMVTFGFDFVALAATGLIWWTLISNSLPQRLFSNSIIRFFGKISYGMYIYHVILYIPAQSYIIPLATETLGSKILGAFAFVLICFVTVTVFSYFSFQVFERRFLNLKNLFPYDSNVDLLTKYHLDRSRP